MELIHRVVSCQCPACNATLNAVPAKEGGHPRPSDLTTCCYCGAILVFKTDLTLAQVTVFDNIDQEVLADLKKMYQDKRVEKNQ